MTLTDWRSTARGLFRRRTFVGAAVLSIGVGIGAATTVLSVVMTLLVRQLPYADADRLVAVWPGKALASREVDAIRRQVTAIEHVASVSPGWLMSLTGVATPRQLDAARTAGDVFDLLGVPPLLGRTYGTDAERTGADHVAVVSYDLWQSQFGGSRDIIGRSILLDGEPHTIVAVMPRTFQVMGFASDLWIPLPADHSAMWWTGSTELAYGRLRAGRTVRAASTELATVAPRMEEDLHLGPGWRTGARVAGLQESLVGTYRSTVLLIAGGVGLLLALAGANVATLLLVRAEERRHELAVRVGLGASRRRIYTLVAAESLLIGSSGGALGVALSVLGVSLIVHILPPDLPRLAEIRLDASVLLGASLLTAVVTLAVAIVPATRALRDEPASRVGESGRLARAGARARTTLVSFEMALALVLTIGASLMGRTLVAIHHVDPGLRSDHLLTMRVEPIGKSDDARRAYWDEVIARVDAIPGVQSAATLLHLPMSGRSWNAAIRIDGRPLPADVRAPEAHWQSVSVGYFATVGVPILEGRPFAGSDDARAPRVIAVNNALAQALFPGANPVGQRISAGRATNNQLATIVAVVGSVQHDSLTAPPTPEVYVPFDQQPVVATSLLVRTSVPPLTLVSAIQSRIWGVDRNVPIDHVMTMDELLGTSTARQRMVLVLFAVFAGIGLFLGAVGVYGVVAYGVEQRLKELGIRIALGASSASIRRLVLLEGLRYAVMGGAVGGILAIIASRVLQTMVYGVPPTDGVSFVLAGSGLLLVVLVASWIPAERAARVPPTSALMT